MDAELVGGGADGSGGVQELGERAQQGAVRIVVDETGEDAVRGRGQDVHGQGGEEHAGTDRGDGFDVAWSAVPGERGRRRRAVEAVA